MRNYLGLLFSLLLLLPLGGYAQRWEKIGERTLGNKNKEKTITINCAHQGKFRMLKIAVENTSVEFENVSVEFLSGSTQELKIRDYVSAGRETRPIDLRGDKRVIKKIELTCKPKEKAKGNNKARIIVYGRT